MELPKQRSNRDDAVMAEDPDSIRFHVEEPQAGTALSWLVEGISGHLTGLGFRRFDRTAAGSASAEPRLVLNPFPAEAPKPYRRRSQSVFVIGVTETDREPDDVLQAAYPLLVRSLSNLLIYIVHGGDGLQVYFVTLERGYYRIPSGDGHPDLFREAVRRLLPLATSRLVINNRFDPDLPEELWEGDALTASISRAGRRLDQLNLLPAPFPIQELLEPRDYRHLQRLFSIGGLSYGNVSVRKDENRFWMSASGVDKSNMRQVGRDIQLVKGYDPVENAMLLSVPPGITPRRVSVDAIEHWLIYREHPQVGAILHVHAWMDGVASTEINYPCGTIQLAEAVAERVRAAEDPGRAVVGLRNHGLTITGPDLDEIFARIEGRIRHQVPML